MAARISVSRERRGLGHPEARALVLRAAKAALKAQAPELDFYRAFTSPKIRAIWEKRGESINGFVGRAISETMQRDALELPGAGQTDPDTESKRAALLEKLQGVSAGDDSKE